MRNSLVISTLIIFGFFHSPIAAHCYGTERKAFVRSGQKVKNGAMFSMPLTSITPAGRTIDGAFYSHTYLHARPILCSSLLPGKAGVGLTLSYGTPILLGPNRDTSVYVGDFDRALREKCSKSY